MPSDPLPRAASVFDTALAGFGAVWVKEGNHVARFSILERVAGLRRLYSSKP
jgi:hypothetical protein